MAEVELEIRALSRNFGSGGGIHNLSLTIERGELFVLLGPSGSGKSTLLRLIAGLENADSGQIAIAGSAQARRSAVAMVFQSFALYPHMTAFENIAFPLRLRHVARAEIQRAVAKAAALASLTIDLDRHPGQLSGGERQRVALARALVREPRVILMDEPLASLDQQLRDRLRIELKEFQRRTGRTLIYVTHDQLEALTLADRMAIMRDGKIEQMESPDEIYRRPSNLFVASFVGQPPMNILRVHAAAGAVTLEDGQIIAISPPNLSPEDVYLGIRPEDLSPQTSPGALAIEVSFERMEFIGSGFLLHARAGAQSLIALSKDPLPIGQPGRLHFNPATVHFFDANSQRRLSDRPN